MSRSVRWSILVAIPLVLLTIWVVSVPFRRWEFFIDRHSGLWNCTVTWCGVITLERPIANPTWPDPSIVTSLTAEVRAIHLGHMIQRYPWSSPSRIISDLPHAWYAEAFGHLFFNIRSRGSTKLSAAEHSALIRERIPIWNSVELDRDPRAVAEAAQAENAKITGVTVANSFVTP